MPICSAYNTFFLSFGDLLILLLQYYMLLCLPPTGSNCLTNGARLDLFKSYKYCIYFIMNWIRSFILKLVDASSRGLAYARRDILYMNMLWLQVYWGWSKLLVYINCLLLTGRVFFGLII